MIKVNLLKDTTHKKSSGSMPKLGAATGGGSLLWIGVVVALLVAAALGFMWFDNDKKIKEGQQKQTELKQEEQRLQALRQELVKFEELKAQRQSRIDVIERLKESQKGPVSLLNAIIHAVPSKGNLWLTLLEQKDNGIKVLGETRTPDVLPDLMNNLTGSGLFASVDVEVIERNENTSKFSIICASKQSSSVE
ncbi:MAG: PilN domain-containing protein [Acidobacteriota bacterium]|jgi:Tfp pilus assembly protein PilN|nr:PilN domain-containing protein [Acidobacteriota bacterium]